MAMIDIMLQGKGGVGKSYCAGLLAQYYLGQGRPLLCFDTDPVNQTFARFPAYNVEVVLLGDRQDDINPRYFDVLIEKILEAPENAAVVVDNGAATFLPLMGYMAESGALEVLQEAGHDVRLHSVLTGGQAFGDTTAGLADLLDHFDSAPVVVWLNEYFGRVGPAAKQGLAPDFEDTKLYKENEERIHALVRLGEVRRETFGHDIEAALKRRQSFEEAIEDPEVNLMARQRLRMVWRRIKAALDGAHL